MVRLAALKVARIAGSITRPVAHRRGKCDPVKARYSGGCTPSGDPMPTGYPPELRPGQYKDPCEGARSHADCGGPGPDFSPDLSPVVDWLGDHAFQIIAAGVGAASGAGFGAFWGGVSCAWAFGAGIVGCGSAGAAVGFVAGGYCGWNAPPNGVFQGGHPC